MTNTKALEDIRTIRQMMERSVRFSSLSGISGILAGIYALIGSYLGYRIVYLENTILKYREAYVLENQTLIYLIIIALAVLAASVLTGYLFSRQKARAQGRKLWDRSTRRVLINFSFPMVIGGLLILIMISRAYYGTIAPLTLIFYGVALFSAGNFTLKEIKWLGAVQTLIGLTSAIYPGYGIVFWALGFGVMHVIYGAAMYLKYER